jgi:hypothetical protein
MSDKGKLDLTYTFGKIEKMESILGFPALKLHQNLEVRNVKIALCFGLFGKTDKEKMEEAGQILQEYGFSDCVEQILTVISKTYGLNDDEPKN